MPSLIVEVCRWVIHQLHEQIVKEDDGGRVSLTLSDGLKRLFFDALQHNVGHVHARDLLGQAQQFVDLATRPLNCEAILTGIMRAQHQT